MRINGTCGLACQKLVKDYQCPEVVLEPLPVFKVLKDLVVDMDSFLEGIAGVRPYLVTSAEGPETERLQTAEEQRRTTDVIRCILCACCTSSCPVMSTNPSYMGPAALVWAYRTLFDSRDEENMERLRQLDDPNGVWACANFFECTQVCPKGIPVTRSINTMKREIEKHLRPHLK
jgi:succinate dehydrogenase / fumarate reductase iron-sulfur subunit